MLHLNQVIFFGRKMGFLVTHADTYKHWVITVTQESVVIKLILTLYLRPSQISVIYDRQLYARLLKIALPGDKKNVLTRKCSSRRVRRYHF